MRKFGLMIHNELFHKNAFDFWRGGCNAPLVVKSKLLHINFNEHNKALRIFEKLDHDIS